MVVLSTRVSYTTQLSGSSFHSGELYNTTEWWYFHSRELYNTTELTHELSDVWEVCSLFLEFICHVAPKIQMVITTRFRSKPTRGLLQDSGLNAWIVVFVVEHEEYLAAVEDLTLDVVNIPTWLASYFLV